MLTFRRTLAAAGAVTLAMAGVLLTAAPANAADFTVTNLDPSGPGSLREAIFDAEVAPGEGHRIVFQAGLTGDIPLASPIEIDEGMTIEGPGADVIRITRTANTHALVFTPDIVNQELAISGLGFANPNNFLGTGVLVLATDEEASALRLSGVRFDGHDSTENGAGVRVESVSGIVDVADAVFENNDSADWGGGLYVGNASDVYLVRTLFSENNAEEGAGAWLGDIDDDVVVQDTTFYGNDAVANGGGLKVNGSPNYLRIYSSWFEDNTSDGPGGAVRAEDSGTIDVFASTFRDNAGATGGGIYALQADTFVVNSSTFTLHRGDIGLSIGVGTLDGFFRVLNSTLDEASAAEDYAIYFGTIGETGEVELQSATIVAPGGLWANNHDGTIDVYNTIIDSGAWPSILIPEGSDASASWSLLSQADDGVIGDDGGNRFSVTDFGLGELTDNGGPTDTRLLLAGSPALDTGDPAYTPGPEFDQRLDGYPRVVGGRIDIGAIEMPATLPATGSAWPLWLPIGAGIVLLLGAAALAFARRGLAA